MALSTFDGPVQAKTGFFSTSPAAVVNLSTTQTLTVAAHAGRILRVNLTSGTITLPTLVATADPAGSGPGADPNNLNNLGAIFTFFIETAATALKISTNGTDKYVGMLQVMSSATVTGYASGATNDVINLNGGTTGGVEGSFIQIYATAANKYMVQGSLIGAGVITTPFADA